MKNNFFFYYSLLALFTFAQCNNADNTTTDMRFEDYPTYEEGDLGVTYTPDLTTIKVWSPAAEAMRLHLYEKGHEGNALETVAMKKDNKTGVWLAALKGNHAGKYYTVQTQWEGKWLAEAVEPYARTTGANGQRAMILDLRTTDPVGWATDRRPPLANYNDIVLYELHVRDLSWHPSSGITNKGKFLGLAETGTRSPEGLATGIDHLKALGITHLHLLPAFDFSPRSVDETDPAAKYNWGYDPQNYNVPEGSYATNPYDGAVRVREFKQMVKALHDNGIRVVMDVVYNHTGDTEDSYFNRIAPGYYYRQNADGTFSNASGCGNETASERPMMRKFMLESMKYWVQEYHIDGFRVDLMGIHDIETMNLISRELRAIDPTVFIYGEGWTAGGSPLPDDARALKQATHRLDHIAAFSDDLRDALKGSVFDHADRGFVSGKTGMEESIKFGIVASTNHPQIDFAKVNYSKAAWAKEPFQTISYVSCHDNHTLFDKLQISNPAVSEAQRMQMHRLALAIVLTSQGVPFLHAGVEMARTKKGVENSFESPDDINQIDWRRKQVFAENVTFVQQLIALRRAHPAFRMTSAEMIAKKLSFLKTDAPNVVGYVLHDHANGDSWEEIAVLFNGNATPQKVDIPRGKWKIVVNGATVDLTADKTLRGGKATLSPYSAMVLAKE